MTKDTSKKNMNLKQILTMTITIILFIGLIYIANNVDILNEITVANYNSIDEIPEYSSQIYARINNGKPYFTEEDYTTESFEEYSKLDDKGRCGVAYANICKEIMPPDGDE